MRSQTEVSKVVAITGCTRGIGLGLAEAFLVSGCSVVISDRDQQKVDHVCTELARRHDTAMISGRSCDVGSQTQVEQLWKFGVTQFGKIDI